MADATNQVSPAYARLRVQRPLLLTKRANRTRRMLRWLGHGVLLLITSSSALAVLFIFFFIARDAWPFIRDQGLIEFLFRDSWYPSRATNPSFGALPIFVGTGLVTLGAALVAIPLGVVSAICLSDILPFKLRQMVKPVIEVLAAIPSVAFGFFALVVFAPLLQTRGGALMAAGWWLVSVPIALLVVLAGSDVLSAPWHGKARRPLVRGGIALVLLLALGWIVWRVGQHLLGLQVLSGANALNVSIILGVMALPTIISVSEDALQAVGRDLREGAYALGSTRAETLLRVVLPAASSGIVAAVILGLMRVVGETMVVWMASGNAPQIPKPWYDFLEPVRTLTATIAGDMGEADHVTGSARYHVLWAMALALLVISFVANLISERIAARSGLRRV